MKQCQRCGKKGLFLLLTEDRICQDCLVEIAKEKKKIEQQQKEAEERRIAAELSTAAEAYNRLVDCYQNFAVDLSSCSVSDLEAAITAGNTFCELLSNFAAYPAAYEVFKNNCDDFGSHLYCKDLGFSRIEYGPEGMVLDSLRDDVRGKCAKYQEIIYKSNGFESLLASIPLAPLPSVNKPPFSRKSNILPMVESNITKRTSLAKVSTFFAIDTETTGLSILNSEILQISAIRFVNFEPVEALTSFVHPFGNLNSAAQNVNHITWKDVADAPPIEVVLPAFDTYFDKKIPIVGHNLSFDYNFLDSFGSRVMIENQIGDRKFYDTLSLSKREYSLESKFNLDYLCRMVLGIIRSNAHNSLSDALAAGLLFKSICEARIF